MVRLLPADDVVDLLAIDIVCAGRRGVRLTQIERNAVVIRLTWHGRSAREIADVLGMWPRSITRLRAEMGMTDATP